MAVAGESAAADRARFFALSSDLFMAAGFDGRIRDMNPAWERALGFTREEVIGRAYVDFVHPNDAATAAAQMPRLADGEHALGLECRFRTKDGAHRWLSWTGTSDLPNEVVYFVARDVTEARQSEETHREHEALFALMTRSAERQLATLREQTRMLDMANDSIMVWDLDGRVLFWNHGAEEMYGWSQAEAMGQQVHVLLQTSFPVSREEALGALSRDGRWAGELHAVRRDGNVITVQSRWALHRDDETGGEVVVSVNEDTTEHRKTELALRESEARFRAVFASAAIGIALVDMAGRVVEANPALDALLGWDEGELRSARLSEVVLAEDAGNDDEMFRDLVAGRRPHYRIEKRFRRLDGAVIPGRVTASLVRDPAGVPRFVIVMIEDLSLALIDELTGLNNRRSFIAFGEQQLLVAERSGRPLTLLFVDLDGMKAINDGYGHQEGDRALVAVAGVLARTFRASDFLARIGGDEFCVILSGTDDDPDVAVTRLRDAAEDWNHRVRAGGWRLSLSAGAGRYEPGSGRSIEDLIREADAAMYRQKAGRASARG